MPYKAVALPH